MNATEDNSAVNLEDTEEAFQELLSKEIAAVNRETEQLLIELEEKKLHLENLRQLSDAENPSSGRSSVSEQ